VPTTTLAPTPTTPVPAGVPTTVLGGVGGAIFLVVLAFLLLRRKKKRKIAGGKDRDDDADDAGTEHLIVPPAWTPDARPNPEVVKAETASIRADLDRMAQETPESLAALLSSWLTKG
jgi:flagellar biosynthesis/type III secretory pathway M-ring protein FliF/YscJ